MGPRYWRHFVPYDADTEAALQRLRHQVFDRGEYTYTDMGKANQVWEMIGWNIPNPELPEGKAEIEAQKRILSAAQNDSFEGLSAEEEELAQHLQTVLGMLAVAGVANVERPKTIEALIEASGTDGTRSILDIEKVGTRLGTGVAAPVPNPELWQAFGSTHPDHEQVEKGWKNVTASLGRWQAYYVVVYRDQQPAEYAFIGSSGD